MLPKDDDNRKVSCRCGSLQGDAVYEVLDKHLILRSNFGVHKALLGFQKPRRVARRLLQNICRREAAKTPANEVAMPSAPTVPLPAAATLPMRGDLLGVVPGGLMNEAIDRPSPAASARPDRV